MVQFRIWPTTAAIAMLATTAMAFAGPTPNDIGTVRPVSPVHRPVTLVRHPVAVAPRPVVRRVNPRVNPDASDDALLARINRIDHEDCAMVMRERADFDPAILAGIIEQRQAECARMRFDRGRHLAVGQFRDADDRRFNDDRRVFATNRGFIAPRPDVRDDRLINRLRTDDRRDDRRFSAPRPNDRRDDRVIRRLRMDDRRDDRHTVPAHFAAARHFQMSRVASANHRDRSMGRPRP